MKKLLFIILLLTGCDDNGPALYGNNQPMMVNVDGVDCVYVRMFQVAVAIDCNWQSKGK